ncbi:hypothetical protein H0H92_010449, partial [Tricholoma furcatifolium]
MAPYPGDPENYLQKRGPRFKAYLTPSGLLKVYDYVRDRETYYPSRYAAKPSDEPGLSYARECSLESDIIIVQPSQYRTTLPRNCWAWNAERILELGAPYSHAEWRNPPVAGKRFSVTPIEPRAIPNEFDAYQINDSLLSFQTRISREDLHNQELNLPRWYYTQLMASHDSLLAAFGPDDGPDDYPERRNISTQNFRDLRHGSGANFRTVSHPPQSGIGLELNAMNLALFGQQVERGTYPALHRTAARRKRLSRVIPKPAVVVVHLNGHPVRAMIDSGSLGDFVSTTVAEQLKLKKEELNESIPVQLAAPGSRTSVNYGTTMHFEYEGISCQKYMDVMNLHTYDVILGTPFIYQHKITVGLNPITVSIGSKDPLPMKEGSDVSQLSSRAMELYEEGLEKVRTELKEYALPLCKSASETPLPPLRAINHEIPLIDESKIYSWRPSRCPEALRPQWDAKRAAYVETGRWRVTANGNAVPMMFIRKPGKPGDPPRMRN